MLERITELTEDLIRLIKDDPVRPEITADFRVKDGRVYVLRDDGTNEPQAVVCVKFCPEIPDSVESLANSISSGTAAVFYTIWSYAAGAGQRLISEAAADIKNSEPTVREYVTLSPKTEMARRFHHKNGASTYRENTDSVNYRYTEKINPAYKSHANDQANAASTVDRASGP